VVVLWWFCGEFVVGSVVQIGFEKYANFLKFIFWVGVGG
jgi:hypothetical protein